MPAVVSLCLSVCLCPVCCVVAVVWLCDWPVCLSVCLSCSLPAGPDEAEESDCERGERTARRHGEGGGDAGTGEYRLHTTSSASSGHRQSFVV